MAYDSLCTPKGMGGLSFMDLRLFNIALLGRQVWRLINNKDTLCYRVLCSKYFSNGDVLNPKAIDKPSFFWMSILHAVKALETGWGFEGLDGNPLGTFFNGIWDSLVSDLVKV
ncbi:Cyclopropane-fatty-acyl-phospholipid synthase [Gossypium australe]|uniref:Cyclopropane-fatty-acyl-phospholipid synthase n=1 Tax=Gossypium australe TaxID=47621 RepID=A0A5B6UD96_9ROSI|nr:Cyclopropane-fatty-acyl-phospholipid synthase [Gossypium australe]